MSSADENRALIRRFYEEIDKGNIDLARQVAQRIADLEQDIVMKAPQVADMRQAEEQIHTAINRVAPSFIRVEADQVTYDLHIILRFEIELQLVEGILPVKDVPGRWNEQFEKLFGLQVPDDARGCLQDIHWSLGAFGYFPTYTLGNLNAAQLMESACKQVPGLTGELAAGNYASLLQWLRTNVHAAGQRHTPQELMEKATGATTQTEPHLAALRRKFA